MSGKMATMLRAAALNDFRDLVTSLGGRPDQLLKKYHIAPKTITAPDGLVPLHSFVHLLEDTAQRLECPDFGLQLAALQDVSFLGPLAVGMRSTETLAEAMRFIARYLFIHSPGISLTVVDENKKGRGLAEVRFAMTLPNIPVTRQVHDLGLGNTHQIMRFLAGDKYDLVAVDIPHHPIASTKEYQRFFGAPIRTNQPFARVIVRQACLRMPVQSADPLVRQMTEHYLTSLYPVPGQSLAPRVSYPGHPGDTERVKGRHLRGFGHAPTDLV